MSWMVGSYLVFWLARLTTRRAVDCKISSTSIRPFSCNVRPVCTRSTTTSLTPTKGASSTAPPRQKKQILDLGVHKYPSAVRAEYLSQRSPYRQHRIPRMSAHQTHVKAKNA